MVKSSQKQMVEELIGSTSDVVLIEIPFVLKHKRRQFTYQDVQICEHLQKLRFWLTLSPKDISQETLPEESPRAAWISRELCKSMVEKGIRPSGKDSVLGVFPVDLRIVIEKGRVLHYLTSDIRWFLDNEQKGLVERINVSHRGIQKIDKFKHEGTYYTIHISSGEIQGSVSLKEGEIFQFKKFQQGVLRNFGKFIPSIKKQLWESILSFCFRNMAHAEDRQISSPKGGLERERYVRLLSERGFQISQSALDYLVEKRIALNEVEGSLEKIPPGRFIVSIEDIIDLDAIPVVKKLHNKIEDLQDQLEKEAESLHKKRLLEDKKVMRGIMK